MQKLLIADSSDIFISALRASLEGQFQISVCTDGQSTLEQLQLEQPDILILNLMLPHKDGLTVLQQTTFQPSVILAITMYMSAYVEQAITSLGVDYTMIAPSVESVVLRLRDLLGQYRATTDHTDPTAAAVHHLHLLNVPTHLDGYRQLCLALPMFAKNPRQLLTKELYPAVARLCGCPDGRAVEHSIRKAIQAAWHQKDNAIWRKYFTLHPHGKGACPTNKEFICRLAEILNNGTGLF